MIKTMLGYIRDFFSLFQVVEFAEPEWNPRPRDAVNVFDSAHRHAERGSCLAIEKIYIREGYMWIVPFGYGPMTYSEFLEKYWHRPKKGKKKKAK